MSPIRTASRRNAALRAVLGWPLRSWRTATTAAIVFTAAILVFAVFLAPDQRPAPPRPVARPAPAAPATPPRPAVDPVIAQFSTLAERTAAAWVNHPGNDSPNPPPADMDSKHFAGQFEKLATAEFRTRLETIAPGNIPEDRVTGQPRVSPPRGSIVHILVPVERRTVDHAGTLHTEPMLLSITAVRTTEEGWRVNRIDAKPGL